MQTTEQFWTEELAYILSINPKHPGKSFNDDPSCFGGYCLMQSNRAERLGFQAIADDILLHGLEQAK